MHAPMRAQAMDDAVCLARSVSLPGSATAQLLQACGATLRAWAEPVHYSLSASGGAFTDQGREHHACGAEGAGGACSGSAQQMGESAPRPMGTLAAGAQQHVERGKGLPGTMPSPFAAPLSGASSSVSNGGGV